MRLAPDVLDPVTIDILPHPFRPDEERIFVTPAYQREEVSAESPVIPIVWTDATEDRHGSVLDPGGWDIDSYLRNNVVLWSHEKKLPAIGNGVNVKRERGRWVADLDFAGGMRAWDEFGAGNVARLVHRLMVEDVIRAISQSFIPKEWEDRKAETIPSFFAENVRYLKQELTEISPVNVPSNRNGLKRALERGVVSENEIDLLGAGMMLRLAPIEVRSEPKAAPKSAPQPTGHRCGECYGSSLSQEAEEPVPSEVQSFEVAQLNALGSLALDLIEIGLAGWKQSRHESMRNQFRYAITDGLFHYDAVREKLKRLYSLEPEETPTDELDEDVREFAGADDWAGAVRALARKTEVSLDETSIEQLRGLLTERQSVTEPDGPVDVDRAADALLKRMNIGAAGTGSPDAEGQKRTAEDTDAPEETRSESPTPGVFSLILR